MCTYMPHLALYDYSMYDICMRLLVEDMQHYE